MIKNMLCYARSKPHVAVHMQRQYTQARRKMKVRIGIIPAVTKDGGLEIDNNYLQYIESAGAEAVELPYPISAVNDEALARCQGFMFLGGADISPERYGESAHEALGETIPARDEYELAIFRKIFNTGKPIFAICRGMQLVNCALGGSLYQDLPSQCPTEVQHRCKEATYAHKHTARFVDGNYLHGVLGGRGFTVNSYHHQAIKTLGEGLSVMAEAPDGIIEAVYHTGERILWGFQWHPERMLDRVSRRVIDAFISACGDAGERREVQVTVDRPIGTRHPKFEDTVYSLNYGYIDGVIGGDGEEQDVYIYGVDEPIATFCGELVAVIYRDDDNETKWVAAPKGAHPTVEEIRHAVDFQERHFESYIEMLN